MYQVSVKHPDEPEFTALGTFPSYETARRSIFDSVALCGGRIAGYQVNAPFPEIPDSAEIMTITADKEVVEYTITRHDNDNA